MDDGLVWQSFACVFTGSTLTCSPLELATGVSGTGRLVEMLYISVQEDVALSARNAEPEIYFVRDVNK